MKEWAVEALDDGGAACASSVGVGLAGIECMSHIRGRAVAVMSRGRGRDGRILLAGLDVGHLLGNRGSRWPANVGDAEDGLPGLGSLAIESTWSGVSEAGRDKCTLRPAIVDVGKVPIDLRRGGITIELVTNIDQVLNRGDINIVHGGKVEDDSPENGKIFARNQRLAFPWTRVIPWTILNMKVSLVRAEEGEIESIVTYPRSRIAVRIRTTGFLENGMNHEVKIVVCVGVVISFREAIDENAWIRLLHFDLGIAAVIVRDWQEGIA